MTKMYKGGKLVGIPAIATTITENSENTDDVYKLDIKDVNGTFTTPNLIGKQGEQGVQGTSPFVIWDKSYTKGDGVYSVDSSTNKATFYIPIPDSTFVKRAFKVYVMHTYNLGSEGGPQGFMHFTVFPKILAYPSTSLLATFDGSVTTSGGAVATSMADVSIGTYNADTKRMSFEIKPSGNSTAWQDNLYVRVVQI